MNSSLLEIGPYVLSHLDFLWTLMLLSMRFSGLMLILPGIGGGERGQYVRMSATLVFAFASMGSSPLAPLPPNVVIFVTQAASEIILGFIIGALPLLIVSGAQMAGQLSATTMGLGAAQLVDPTLGVNLASLGRILGDLVTVLFLLLGGHYAIFRAAAGLGGTIVPGSFLLGQSSIDVLVEQSAHIFWLGVMISAPVIVALLLTQFVMGLITKAVPTVNIFIVSFPLTIGIGLVLTAISMPDVYVLIEHQFQSVEPSVLQVLSDATSVAP